MIGDACERFAKVRFRNVDSLIEPGTKTRAGHSRHGTVTSTPPRLRDRTGSRWIESASLNRLACWRGSVRYDRGYEQEIKLTTVLGVGGTRAPVSASLAYCARMRPSASVVVAVRGFGNGCATCSSCILSCGNDGGLADWAMAD